MQGEERDCTWENFRKEKRKSKLKLDPKIYPGFESAKAYEETYFERRMYVYGAYKHSNLEGPNSAVVITWLLKYSDDLDRGQAPNFGAVLADINSRVQDLSTAEQNKVLPVIVTYPATILHSDRELHAIPLVYTALHLCDKPGITPDNSIPNRLIWIQKNLTGDWEQVAADPRRNNCVLDVTKKSVEMFEKMDPRSKLAVIAHEHLAKVYDQEAQFDNVASEYLKILQLNSEGVKGEIPSDYTLRYLFELYVKEKKFAELSVAFNKFSTAIATSSEALQCARLVQDLIRAGGVDATPPIAADIFSKFNFEEPTPPAPLPANVFQVEGCGGVPRYFSQPSWHLAGWLSLMCEAGHRAQAQVLYNQCIEAAAGAKKASTKEFQLSVDCATTYSLKKATW